MIIRRLAKPLLNGRALIVAPEYIVLRWPLESGPPVIGDVFPDDGIDVRGKESDWRAVLSGPPLSRCEAALSFEVGELRAVYSYSQISNMRRVGRELCNEVRNRARTMSPPASLRALIAIAWAGTMSEQVKKWNEYLERRR